MASLPDEILQNIVQHLAGELVYDKGYEGYIRRGRANFWLRNLRLVKRRFAQMCQNELYCAPSTMTSQQEPLSSDHLDILLHPGIGQSARMLSLAGSSAFFAGLLKTGFTNLTCLTLLFTVPHVNYNAIQARSILEEKSVAQLRTIIQTLPLKELRIRFKGKLNARIRSYFQTVRLGAGHAIMQHFAIDAWPQSGPGILHDDPEYETMDCTSFLTSLTLRHICSDEAEDVQVIEAGLGSLPNLTRLSIDTSNDSGDVTGAIKALTSALKQNVPCLNLAVDVLPPTIWDLFGSFPRLQSLILRSCWLEKSDMELAEAHLPALKTIRLDCISGVSFITTFLNSLAAGRLFPSLRSLHIVIGEYSLPYSKQEELLALISAYDGYLARSTGVSVTPANIRETLVQKLQVLVDSGSGR